MSQSVIKTEALKLKSFKKIPIYVVEEHHRALSFIYSAIGGKKLPVEGTTLLHFDAHPDMLINSKLKGKDARAGRQLFPYLEIENWIVPAAAAGHIGRVIWLRPPWAKQFSDGTREIRVGDNPETGLLQVDSMESYYLSDALYCPHLVNTRTFTFTVAELNAEENEIDQLSTKLNIRQPYVLDIDLDFFSTGNPFLSLCNNIELYDLLEPIFRFETPDKNNIQETVKAMELRKLQLEELEALFLHLDKYKSLEQYEGKKTDLFVKVSELATTIMAESECSGHTPDWWIVYAAGCTRDQGGLPYHISSEEEIKKSITDTFKNLMKKLPPPVLITVARSTEDGYCPSNQVDLIQKLVLTTLKELYDTDEPMLDFLNND